MLHFCWSSTVNTVIKELQDEAIDPHSLLNARGAPRKQELMLLTNNLEEALKELDGIVRKYQGLARRERRIWTQLKLATEDLEKIRGKMTFHVTAISAFTSSLSRGTLAQIETVLLELVSEVRQGRREPSLLSLHEDNNDSVWRELELELAEDGISSVDVAKHKTAIKIFVQDLHSGSGVDTTSLIEVASLLELDNNGKDTELFSLWGTAECSPGFPTESVTVLHTQNSAPVSVDDEKDENAVEELPLTDAHTGSEFDDALAFVDQINAQSNQQPGLSRRFLDVLRNYQEKIYGTIEVMDWLSTLFFCHPDLIQKLNIFLPFGHKIECGTVKNHFALRLIMPSTAFVKIADLEVMPSLTVKEEARHIGQPKWIDPASHSILRPCSGTFEPLDWTAEQPASSPLRVTKASRTLLN